MKNINIQMTKFPYISALFFSFLLFLGCTLVEHDNPCDEATINYNPNDPICVAIRGIRGRGNNISNYRTVRIGDQMWMAENLDYAVEGSICYGDEPANCTKYGRLYNWATAKTVCPSGWHLPSDAEWDILVTYAGGSFTAGSKLKAKSGWHNNGNGNDQFGFSALPGGLGSLGGNFNSVGSNGDWGSATEVDASGAMRRYMGFYYDDVGRNYYGKSGLFSVRCVQERVGC